jgi:RimJ/RimL family protein N-acetyltransferase
VIVARNIGPDVLDFVAQRMPLIFGDSIRQGGYAGLGVLDDDGYLVAGVVFNQYEATFGTLAVHVAATTPKWASRNIIRVILGYAFEEVGVNKVWAAMPHTNYRAIRFNQGIGFKREAVLSHHFGAQHAVITAMFAKDFKRFYADDGGIQALKRHRVKMRQVLQIKEAA